MEIVRVFVSMPNGTIYESDSDHRQNVVAAGVRQRPSQKWWSGPTDVPRVYYQKKDPDDRGPVVTPDFAKVERERMAREIRERELGRRAMLRFNRHRVRNLLMRNTMAKELAEERLADVRRAEMFAQPTGRHDPNPYESDSTAREYDQLVDRRDGTRVTLIQRDREVAVASINYARSIMHFAKRLVLSMPIDEAIDALKAVRANRAFPPQADPLDEWDAAMRSPNFIGYLQATHGKRSRDITLLQQEERLYKARVNIWYAEQEARREAEESERHAQECDPFAAYVGARDVFGDPIPRPVPVRQPATLDAGRRHNMHIRHTITVATKLIPAFAHQKTKLLLTRLGWNSTMVVTGDPAQTDLLPDLSGLATIAETAVTLEKSGPRLAELARSGLTAMQVYEHLVIDDLRLACDVLRPVWEEADHADGFCSLEVAPSLAHDTEQTMDQARSLWERVGRPNLMIKIPGTDEGAPAIEEMIYEGRNINVTLLFSVDAYEKIAEAYIRGLERRHEEGLSLDVHSVASFFVSRVDTEVDKRLAAIGREDLQGTAAVANARAAYQAFERLFRGERFARLAAAGASVQRPLWASTGVKDPAYPDTLYVSDLVAEGVVTAEIHAISPGRVDERLSFLAA